MNATAKKIDIHADFADKLKHKTKRVTLEEAGDQSHWLTTIGVFERPINAAYDNILTQLQWRFETFVKSFVRFQFPKCSPTFEFVCRAAQRMRSCSIKEMIYK